jgi:hypothetical protein
VSGREIRTLSASRIFPKGSSISNEDNADGDKGGDDYDNRNVGGAVNNFLEFFDIDGLMQNEFVPPEQNATGHFYPQDLQRLRDAIRRKRSDKWQGQRFLHLDNAASHTSPVVLQFLAEKNIPVITQPPYSPDLV